MVRVAALAHQAEMNGTERLGRAVVAKALVRLTAGRTIAVVAVSALRTERVAAGGADRCNTAVRDGGARHTHRPYANIVGCDHAAHDRQAKPVGRRLQVEPADAAEETEVESQRPARRAAVPDPLRELGDYCIASSGVLAVCTAEAVVADAVGDTAGTIPTAVAGIALVVLALQPRPAARTPAHGTHAISPVCAGGRGATGDRSALNAGIRKAHDVDVVARRARLACIREKAVGIVSAEHLCAAARVQDRGARFAGRWVEARFADCTRTK